MSADLSYLSLDEAARRLTARTVSSVDLTTALLDRIAALDPRLHAFATVTADRALAEAAQRDAETAAGRPRGPLHGVPVAVKDLCDTAGVATAAGMAIRHDHVPDRDATVVRRLREAGAVILGKLQMTEGAYGVHHPSVTPPVNPWHADYWTGVSSSGSGVATAAGLCFASLGSDTGGSIRFPSTMNGVSGLKPTWGRVSRAGVFPLAESLDHVGPMCRSALDCAHVLGVIAGADPDDPTASPRLVPDYVAALASGIAGRRLGLPRNLIGLDADSVRTVETAASVLTAAGARPVDVTLPDLDRAAAGWIAMCGVEAALAHEATFPARRGEYGADFAGLLDVGRALSGLELARLNRVRAEVRGNLDALLETVDVLLLPVMGVAAPPLAAMRTRTPEGIAARLRYTAPLDMTGHPSLTIPGGVTAHGVPVGFQLVARAFDEATILAAGHAFQQATDWHMKRPSI